MLFSKIKRGFALLTTYIMMLLRLPLISLLFLSTPLFSEELPKECFGKYGGEMSAYSVIVDGLELDIEAHDVFIKITSENISYTGGKLMLSGTYTSIKQSKDEYIIKVLLTNGKTLSYEMDFIWNKKKNIIYVTPKNGQSEVTLERLDG